MNFFICHFDPLGGSTLVHPPLADSKCLLAWTFKTSDSLLRVLPAACLYIAPLHLSWRHFCPSAFFHFCCFYDFCPRFFLFYFVFRDNFSDCLVAVSRGGVPGAAGGAGEVRTLYLLIFFSVDLFKPVRFI